MRLTLSYLGFVAGPYEKDALLLERVSDDGGISKPEPCELYQETLDNRVVFESQKHGRKSESENRYVSKACRTQRVLNITMQRKNRNNTS